MADSSKNEIPDFGSTLLRKTLFIAAPGTVGVLVETIKGRMQQKQMTFGGRVDAQNWCDKHRVNLYYFYPDEPSQN